MGIVFFFYDTGAKQLLLKRYRCLTRYFKKEEAKNDD